MRTVLAVILLVLSTVLLIATVASIIFALSRSWALFGALPYPFCYVAEILFLLFAIALLILLLLVAAATLWVLIDWRRKR